MKYFSTLAFGLSLIICNDPSFAQIDFSHEIVEHEQIGENVYVLKNGLSGNVVLLKSAKGFLMVDAMFAQLNGKILEILRQLGDGRVEYVINTHVHTDHAGGNTAFKEYATVVSHANTLTNLMTRNVESAGLPVLTVFDKLSIHFNNEEVQVIHFPNGHTNGDLVVYFHQSKVIHLGDMYFSGLLPAIAPRFGGNALTLRENIREIITMLPEDVKIIPGHGPVSTLDDLRIYYRMLSETIEYVRGKMASGSSLVQITEAGLPSQWQNLEWEYVKASDWLELIYISIINQTK